MCRLLVFLVGLCEIRKRERLFLSGFSRYQQDMSVFGEMDCGTR